MLLEDAAAFAKFGDSSIPGAALRDHHLQHVFRQSRRAAALPTSVSAQSAVIRLVFVIVVPPVVAPQNGLTYGGHMNRSRTPVQATLAKVFATIGREGGMPRTHGLRYGW